MRIANLRQLVSKRLMEAGISEATLDADILIMEALGLTRESLFLCGGEEADEEKLPLLMEWVKRRESREPLQHILGVGWFYGLPFRVGPEVLIPRQETEILVERALKYCVKGASLLDLFTGSGSIPISIAHEFGPGLNITATDISEAAIEIAKYNSDKFSTDIRFAQGDVFDAIPKGKRFDIITANPPYIKEEEILRLEPEVKDHDPMLALSGGGDGLIFYRRLAQEMSSRLNPGGVALMEIGHDQADAVRGLFSREFKVEIIKDYSGKDRICLIS